MSTFKKSRIFVYKAFISYVGTKFKGFQIQKADRTVAGELHGALLKVVGEESSVRVTGASRTDTGVHALDQLCRLEIPHDIPPANLMSALRSYLPSDIKIESLESSNMRFHPIGWPDWKEYRYYFNVIDDLGLFHSPFVETLSFEVDAHLIEKGTKLFLGPHSFRNFYCTGSEVKSYIREILHCSLEKDEVQCPFTKKVFPLYYFRVVGNGFLKQMVRLMVGALWDLGRSKISLAELEGAIVEKTDGKVGPVAPAKGLFLYRMGKGAWAEDQYN